MIFSFEISPEVALEMRHFVCLKPLGSFIVGWIDFDPDGLGDVKERRFALILLRSGRFIASRGSALRSIPDVLFPFFLDKCDFAVF